MLRAVIDTNIIVSGLLSKGNPRKIWLSFKREDFKLVLSPLMLEEIISVLQRPKFHNLINNQDREEVVLFLESFAEFVTPTKHICACRDPEDNHILATALEAQADCIVSGDKDLLVLHPFKSLAIISAKGFISRLSLKR